MARRRKDADWMELVVPLVGLVMLLSLISPQVRKTILAIGFIAMCILGVAVVGLIAFGIHRLVTRLQRTEAVERSIDWKTPTKCNRTPTEAMLKPTLAVTEDARHQEKPFQNTPELIEQLRSIDWFQFEKVVALVYRRLGFMVTRRGGANPDGGIDLVIEKDGERSAVQCKQWKTWNVGVRAVREFLGALTDAGIQKGAFMTLCGYTGEAKQLADKHGIEIVNEVGLAEMLEDTGARFDPEALAILRDTRKFCPKCEAEMVLRTAKKGANAGQTFWGCSTYPQCRFMMPVAQSKADHRRPQL